MLRYICILLSLAWSLSFPPLASATFLRISGDHQLNGSVTGEILHLSGTFSMANEGDELARDVYPAFYIGSHQWKGAPMNLKPSEHGEWKIDEYIPTVKLRCLDDPHCALPDLPSFGGFPLLVRMHYKDGNGYAFSSPMVSRLELHDQPQPQAYDSALEAKITFEGDGQAFKGKLEVHNHTAAPKKASVALFSSRELKLPLPFILDVPANGDASSSFEVENFRGLAGSNYTVFAILQWEHDPKTRDVGWIPEQIELKQFDASRSSIYAVAAATLLLVAGLWIFVFRRAKGKRRE